MKSILIKFKNIFVTIYITFFTTILPGQNIYTICKVSNCQYQDIQKAINSVPEGSILLIQDSFILNDEIKINKSLTIRGNNSNNFKYIIDGNKLKNVFLIKNVNSIVIENLTIQNSGYNDIQEYAGIYIENSKNCIIKNNDIKDNTFGIYLANVQNCLIENNMIKSFTENEVQSGNGIHLWYSYDNIIKNNTILGHRDGLYFEYSQNLLIENNEARKNLRYGIHFMFCHNSRIIGNIFSDNLSGITLMYSKKLYVSNNTFKDSWGKSFKSLLLKEIDSSIITNNYFINNSNGIYTDNSNRNQFYNNIFINNGIAMEILGNSYNNVFYNNIFENNIFDIATNSRDNPNEYYNNYWDKYKGYDLNKDLIGDIPHKPVSVFSYWVSRYPTLAILIRSPMVDFLELIEKVFPILTPSELKDPKPFLKKEIIYDKNKIK